MKENGYMTIYLALTLGVMISLCLALIEGCRYRGICLETECVIDIGMDSILAEYHRELFAQYNLFAVDCSYGTVHGTTKLTEEHLLEYMNHNFSLEDIFFDKILYRDFFALEAEKAEMTKAAFMTDGDGEVFRRMAVDAIEDDVGIGLLQQIKEWVKTIKSRGLLERSVEEEKQTVDAQIREYDGREMADGKVIHIENPTEALEEKKKSRNTFTGASRRRDFRSQNRNRTIHRSERGTRSDQSGKYCATIPDGMGKREGKNIIS